MKTKLSIYFLVFFSINANAQVLESMQQEVHPEGYQCISEKQQEEIMTRIKENKKRLGKLTDSFSNQNKMSMVPLLAWPLREADNFKDYNYFLISNYVDHDASANIQDYNCGARTYDGHTGTDIALSPFPWLMMDNQMVNVVAAAPGEIWDKHDGEYDRNCSWSGQSANYVIVQHYDGTYTWYWHLKNGSVTNLQIGDAVNTGDYLGKVGSSGISTGPHLHFEVRSSTNSLIDPFSSSCNNVPSAWQNQKSYWDPGINKLMTSINSPAIPACPGQETTNEVNHFIPSGTIKYSVYFRTAYAGSTVLLDVFDEQGTNKYSNYYNFTANGVGSSLTWTTSFGSSNSGTWKMQVTYDGKTYVHYFSVFCNTYTPLTGTHTGQIGVIAEGGLSSSATCSNANSEVWYEAETEIVLTPNFKALEGCTFRTNIDNCTVFMPKESSVQTDNSNKLSIAPNPASDFITIKINNASSKTLFKIYNSTMQLVKTLNFDSGIENQISLTDFTNGIYFIDAQSGGQAYKTKFVVSR